MTRPNDLCAVVSGSRGCASTASTPHLGERENDPRSLDQHGGEEEAKHGNRVESVPLQGGLGTGKRGWWKERGHLPHEVVMEQEEDGKSHGSSFEDEIGANGREQAEEQPPSASHQRTQRPAHHVIVLV